MSDTKTLEAQVEALTRGGLSLVESNRQLQSTVETFVREQRSLGTKVGLLCDDLRDYIRRNDQRHTDNERALRESESKIRVHTENITMLNSWRGSVEKRLQDLEATAGRPSTSAAR